MVAAWPDNCRSTDVSTSHQNSSYQAAVSTHCWGFSPLKRSIAETKRKMCRCVDSVDSAGCCQCQRGNRSDTWDTNYRQHRSRGKQSQMEQIIDNVSSRYLIGKPEKSGFFPSCNFVNFVNLNDNEPTEARGYQWYGVTSHVDILNILMKFLFG